MEIYKVKIDFKNRKSLTIEIAHEALEELREKIGTPAGKLGWAIGDKESWRNVIVPNEIVAMTLLEEIQEEDEPTKEEPEYKFNVGDYVEVVNTREQYDLYNDWFKKEGNAPELLERYIKSDKKLSKQKTYRIVARGGHNFFNHRRLYAIEAFDKQIYLIDEQGLKLANVREVKRLAKAGEYVKVVDEDGCPVNEYKNGDILKIIEVQCDFARYKNAWGKYLLEEEYVVLENYKGCER